MKKLWYFIRNIFIGIFVLVMLIFTTLWIALTSPFKMISYRRSHFYRDIGAKFNVGILDSCTYSLYEKIQENGLPIEYLVPRDPKLVCEGWFFAGTTLLLHNLPKIEYCERLNAWSAYPGDDEPICDTITKLLLRIHEDHPGAVIGDIRILMELDGLCTEDLKRAENDPLFLLYSGEEQQMEILRQFCTNH